VVCRGKLDDPRLVGAGDGIRIDDDPLGTVANDCGKSLANVFGPTWTAGPVFAVENGRNAEG
jgi:hypothetical protein